MSLQIIPLHDNHLEDAAALVGARYRALRTHTPTLPPRYENGQTFLPMLHDLAQAWPGVVAIQDGRIVGFLLGLVLPSFLGKRGVYSPEWGNGAELDKARRIYEEMYGSLSKQWGADGCVIHVVTMLGNDRQGIESWQWLGFGLVGVDGVRTLDPVDGAKAAIEIRPAGAEDATAVSYLVNALTQHMTAAPVFWVHDLGDPEKWLNDPARVMWLACEGETVVGCMGIGPANPEACEIILDEKTASIMTAFTLPDMRGKGVATALLNRSLAWAHAQGYARCAVDFETANFLAARFWSRWFEPVCYSLARCIDERVASGMSNSTHEG